jgi:hypothetical protein
MNACDLRLKKEEGIVAVRKWVHTKRRSVSNHVVSCMIRSGALAILEA